MAFARNFANSRDCTVLKCRKTPKIAAHITMGFKRVNCHVTKMQGYLGQDLITYAHVVKLLVRFWTLYYSIRNVLVIIMHAYNFTQIIYQSSNTSSRLSMKIARMDFRNILTTRTTTNIIVIQNTLTISFIPQNFLFCGRISIQLLF